MLPIALSALVAFLPWVAGSSGYAGTQVFLFPATAPVASPETLSIKQASNVLAHWLGVDRWDVAPSHVGADDSAEFEWMRTLGSLNVQDVFGPQSKKGAMIIAVESSRPEDILPEAMVPTYAIPAGTHFGAFTFLLSKFATRASHVYSTVYTNAASLASPSHLRSVESFSSPSAQQFLAEFETISGYEEILSDYPQERHTFGTFEIRGLQMIRAEHGPHSEVYKMAASAVKSLLLQISSHSQRFALIVNSPIPPQSHSPRASPSAQPPQQPLPPSLPPAPPPLFSTSTCFANSTICEGSTSQCSSRGQCTQAQKGGKTCFVCACNVTVDAKGRKLVWVGESCERLDISGPFSLLAGTTIGVLLITIASISLLYSIGNEELPSTLASLGGHIKHE